MSDEIDRRLLLRRLSIAICATAFALPIATSARADDEDDEREQGGLFRGRRTDDDDERRGGLWRGRRGGEDDDEEGTGSILRGRRGADDDEDDD